MDTDRFARSEMSVADLGLPGINPADGTPVATSVERPTVRHGSTVVGVWEGTAQAINGHQYPAIRVCWSDGAVQDHRTVPTTRRPQGEVVTSAWWTDPADTTVVVNQGTRPGQAALRQFTATRLVPQIEWDGPGRRWVPVTLFPDMSERFQISEWTATRNEPGCDPVPVVLRVWSDGQITETFGDVHRPGDTVTCVDTGLVWLEQADIARIYETADNPGVSLTDIENVSMLTRAPEPACADA